MLHSLLVFGSFLNEVLIFFFVVFAFVSVSKQCTQLSYRMSSTSTIAHFHKHNGLLALFHVLFLCIILGLSSQDVIEYLEKGPKEAAAAAAMARGALSDDHMKMLNLTHDWLNSLLPFCLMKIDRVYIFTIVRLPNLSIFFYFLFVYYGISSSLLFYSEVIILFGP